MNHFAPVSSYLTNRLQRTSFEDVTDFRQLLLLEQLIRHPLRGYLEEALFVGLRTQFPRECRILIAEFDRRGIHHQMSSAPREGKSVLGALVESNRTAHREQRWRERADWILAGGLP